MDEDTRSPQINVSKLAVGGGIIGLIFAVGSMAIFFIGIPLLRYMFPAAAVLGCAIALVLRLVRHKTPGAPWLRSATESATEVPAKREHKEHRRIAHRLVLGASN
jgi:sugar phosphate permease